jgi:hypothetical protein
MTAALKAWWRGRSPFHQMHEGNVQATSSRATRVALYPLQCRCKQLTRVLQEELDLHPGSGRMKRRGVDLAGTQSASNKRFRKLDPPGPVPDIIYLFIWLSLFDWFTVGFCCFAVFSTFSVRFLSFWYVFWSFNDDVCDHFEGLPISTQGWPFRRHHLFSSFKASSFFWSFYSLLMPPSIVSIWEDAHPTYISLLLNHRSFSMSLANCDTDLISHIEFKDFDTGTLITLPISKLVLIWGNMSSSPFQKLCILKWETILLIMLLKGSVQSISCHMSIRVNIVNMINYNHNCFHFKLTRQHVANHITYSFLWFVQLWFTPPWHFELHCNPCLKQEQLFVAQSPLQLQHACASLSATLPCFATIDVDRCPSLSLMRGRYIQHLRASPRPIESGVAFFITLR